MKQLCPNIELDYNMVVFFRENKCTLKEAINLCKVGEPIEGIHPLQYDKLLKLFEQERNKKFQYSVDIKYGDWRFILFDIKIITKHVGWYINPEHNDLILPDFVIPKIL